MSSAIREVMSDLMQAAMPPERLPLDSWANKYRRIAAGSSPEAGHFSTSRTPYVEEPMQSVSDPEVETTVCMWSAQLGKTEFELNTCGYFAHMDPCSMMYLMPTLSMAEKISKDRLQPTIECTPVLKKVFHKNKSRSSNSTILSKHFHGGVIHLCGANSPASLSSSPMRGLLADEIDRYGVSAGGEGDPLTIAKERTKNFHNAFVILVSTPTDADSSRIHQEYMLSNQKFRELPCPHCNHFQELEWKNFKFDSKDFTIEPWFECTSCKKSIYNHHKSSMSRKGRWTMAAPEHGNRIDGYRLNEFHSEFSTWMDIRNKFMDCYQSIEKLKVFTNTVLGEVWTDTQTLNDADVIKQRREHYDHCPEDVLAIVAGVDTQDDSLHYEIVGYGYDMQTWGIEYGILRGDPSRPEIWNRLHEKLSQQFERTDGVVLNVMKACIDSGGHHTQDVYNFCKKYNGRYYPIVGRAGKGKPIINRPTKLKQHRNLLLYTVGVDTCKETFLCSRIKQTEVAYGYCHYPFGRGYDNNYFEELTHVRKEQRKVKGIIRDEFVDKGRVEAVDCRVYSMAALEVLNPSFMAIKANINSLKSSMKKQSKVKSPKVDKPKNTTRKVSKAKKNRKSVKDMRRWRGKRK